ncbi:hypothetical protein [Planosporangium thailandense]|uniref:hypothetical protein n=1 Tax=Planosporangium thailandense TaxID=765197 RepID=UPI0030B849B9
MNNTTLERGPIAPDEAGQESAGSRVRHPLRAHPALVGLLLVGATVRVAVMAAYPPAFGYFGDTFAYLKAAQFMAPSRIWPFGYSLFLKCFAFTGHIVTVAVVQHLLGLALGVGVYALLARRGVTPNRAAFAAAPVILDAREIVLEHYVMAETLFTALLLAAVLVLCWRERLTAWMCALAGLVLAAASVTRTIGQPLAVVVLLYLLVRRVGWRNVAVFAVALAAPLAGYLVWYHSNYGVYAFNEMSGRYLWQRTTTFVDCSKNGFTADERKICPVEPVGQREVNDLYLFAGDRHKLANQFPDYRDDHVFASFARKAIVGQPGDFAKTILTDTVHLVQPGWQPPGLIACRTDQLGMVSGNRASGQATGWCSPALMGREFYPTRMYEAGFAAPKITALNGVLWAYGRTFTTWPLVLMLLALFAGATVCWRPRTWRPREAADAVLLSGLGLATLVLSLVLSVVDFRFTVPLLALAPPAAVLAWHRLRGAVSGSAGAWAGSGPPVGHGRGFRRWRAVEGFELHGGRHAGTAVDGPQGQQAREESRADDHDAERDRGRRRYDEAKGAVRVQLAESGPAPGADGDERTREPRSDQEECHGGARLQAEEPRPRRVGVLAGQPFLDPVQPRETAEQEQLHADEHGQAGVHEGAHVEGDVSRALPSRRQPGRSRQAEQREDETGQHECLLWSEDEQEA